MDFQGLLSPIKIGTMEIRNRMMVSPMATNFADQQGFVTQQQLDYYEARAKGGFGLINVEAVAVMPTGHAVLREPGIWSDEYLEGMKKLADAAHRHGAKIVIQIHHAGRETSPYTLDGKKPVAPSAVSCPVYQVTPEELSKAGICEIIKAFGDAAVRAKAAGIDGVEVHGGHGYLLAEFMSAHANKRLDEFGGDIIGRMKLPLEVMKEIRSRVGRQYPVMFRFSGDERIQDGIDANEAKVIARLMEDATVDAMDVSVCTYASGQWSITPSYVPPAFNLYTAEAVKKVVKVPVIAVGKINDPYLAETIIESGSADMVSLGRESIADPEWPKKIAENRIEEISPCIGCLQSCSGYVATNKTLSCTVNPMTGKEGKNILRPADKKKKTMVVGAGPAGLYAAWVAAAKGHNVVLYEKSEKIGGEFRIASIPPAKQAITKALKYYKTMCDKYGVDMKIGTETTADVIKREAPDVVILATGSKPLIPHISGIDNPKFTTASPVLDGKVQVGQKVLIAGGGMVATDTAQFLGERRRDITIVEMLPQIATGEDPTMLIFMMKALMEYRVKILTGATIKSFSDDGITYEKNGETLTLHGFDSVILALGTKAYNPLEEAARRIAPEVYVIGDAVKAGRANVAIESALAVAASI